MQTLWRALEILLGIVWITFGTTFIIYPDHDDFWRRYLTPMSFIVMGMMFLYYGFTGNSHLGNRKL